MDDRAGLVIAVAAGAAAFFWSREAQATQAAQALWDANFAPWQPYDPLAGASLEQLAQDFGPYANYLVAELGTATPGDAAWWSNASPWEIEDAEAGEWWNPWGGGDDHGAASPWDFDDADLGAYMQQLVASGVDPWDKSGGGYVQPAGFTLKPGQNWRVNLYPEFASTIAEYAEAYGVPLEMFEKLLFQESGYRDDIVYGGTTSGMGASGIAQFMPATGRQYGLYAGDVDLRGDPVLSIEAAAKYLAALYRMFANWPHAVAAYNAGPGHIRNYLRGGGYTLKPETIKYVAAIFGEGTTVTV